jgi:hypothetical protein
MGVGKLVPATFGTDHALDPKRAASAANNQTGETSMRALLKSWLLAGMALLERVDIQDSHGLATLIQAPFGRRLG